MKILWFSPSPSLASDYFQSSLVGGGWLKGLESAIHQYTDWQLGIVFNTKTKRKSLVHKTVYFPVYSGQNLLNRLYFNHFTKINNGKKNEYLQIIKYYKPDIIQIFGTEGAFMEILPCIKEIPVIIHLQGILSDIRTHLYENYSRYDLFHYSSLISLMKGSSALHLLKNLENRAERELKYVKYCAFYMGRTDFDRQFIKKHAPEAKYFTCNEVLQDEYYYPSSNIKEINKKFVLLTTINGELYKGIDIILETANKLKQYKIDFEWRIAGINPSDFSLCFFQKKMKLFHESINIKVLGPLKPIQLIDELRNSNLFVHPSHCDNSPNSVCEAQISGIPVLASNTGGIPSLIEHNKTGFLSDVNSDSFAMMIQYIMNDYKNAQKIAQSSQEIAKKRHSKEDIIKKLKEIYSEIL